VLKRSHRLICQAAHESENNPSSGRKLYIPQNHHSLSNDVANQLDMIVRGECPSNECEMMMKTTVSLLFGNLGRCLDVASIAAEPNDGCDDEKMLTTKVMMTGDDD